MPSRSFISAPRRSAGLCCNHPDLPKADQIKYRYSRARAIPNAPSTTILAEIPRLTKANEIAARIAPIVCPVKRAVASIPPATPLRESGADDNIERLFGAWKKPNPATCLSATASMVAKPSKLGEIKWDGPISYRATTESVWFAINSRRLLRLTHLHLVQP
jgi:hypothetical protein